MKKNEFQTVKRTKRNYSAVIRKSALQFTDNQEKESVESHDCLPTEGA